MKSSQIEATLDLAFRARENGDIFNPLFVGPPGLGKTEIVQAYAQKKGLEYIVLTSAVLEPNDVRGFPTLVTTANNRQRMTFITPDFWPETNSTTKGIVILEELNRGTNSIMNAWMSLTDKRRGFDNYRLPEGWIVVGCINPEDSMHDVNTMDCALKDRFEIFNIEYDKQTFLDYMRKENWNVFVRMFVEAGVWEYKLPENIGNVAGSKYLSPRTYSKLNSALQADIPAEFEATVFESILGRNVGLAFYEFKNNENPVLYSHIKEDLLGASKRLMKFSDPKNYKNGHISITISSIVDEGNITDDELATVLTSLPADQGARLVRELGFKRKDTNLLTHICDNYPEVKKLFKTVLKVAKAS